VTLTLQQELVELGLEAALEVAGIAVRYKSMHGTHDLVAMRASSEWDQVHDGTVIREAKSQDWIFPLPITDIHDDYRPQAGDRLSVMIDVGIPHEVYEAMSPGGEQPWRYMSPSWKWVRVFTKKVG
jgi:hypothetical protein